MFMLVAFFVGSLVATFLGFRLTGLGVISWYIAVISIVIILMYPFVWFASLPPNLDAIFRQIIYFTMGMVSVLIGLLLIRDIIFLPLSFFNQPISQVSYSRDGTLITIGLTFILVCYGYWNAARGPEVKQVDIPLPVKDFSIVQISDLHAGPGISAKYVEAVVQTTIKLKPSAIVLTGDIADGSFERYHKEIDSLSLLTKIAPVYYVTGNHEYIKDARLWVNRFQELGLHVLLNEHTILKHGDQQILIAGVTDHQPDISRSLKNAPSASLKILLVHQPKIAHEASPHFDVQLSGHTHSGQFFPWNFAIHLFQEFAKGLEKSESMWVYVNSGTGYWGPPIRIGTRSEITQIYFR